MKSSKQDYELELIDEPLQSHVVAWERASRALKTEDAKPMLQQIHDAFTSVTPAETDINVIMSAFVSAATALNAAIKILHENETLTLSSNHGVMVKAALQAGWIVSFTKSGADIMTTVEEVNSLKPWVVSWLADLVARVYLEAINIPKN